MPMVQTPNDDTDGAAMNGGRRPTVVAAPLRPAVGPARAIDSEGPQSTQNGRQLSIGQSGKQTCCHVALPAECIRSLR